MRLFSKNTRGHSVLHGEEELRRYLWSQYEGVFDERQIERHIEDYIGFEIANQQVNQVLHKSVRGARILDIGSGFGSFVLAAKRSGLDAVGVDIASFEVEFARRRLRAEMPDEAPEDVYLHGSGFELPFKPESFDILTLWNVLEHVSNYRGLLSEAVRVLRPGGYLYIVCPNYASFREEAHYHIFWPSLIPRKIAMYYLRLRGKDPSFFETSIFYRTNWGVLYALRRLGLEVHDFSGDKLLDPIKIKHKKIRNLLLSLQRVNLLWVIRFWFMLNLYNPFKNSVVLYARKRGVL